MGLLNSLAINQQLILRMTVRDVLGRYRGSALGVLWSFLSPIIMLAVYSFVFGLVFKARWGVETEQNFALILFAGLIMHSFLAECLVRAPSIVVSNVNYVKKVVFPIETLAWVSVLSASFHFFISLSILFVALLIMGDSIHLTWLYLPMIFLPLLLVCLGVMWVFSSLGVYVRDVSQMTGILATVLLFLCPIMYPIEAIPEAYRFYIMLNPLSFLVEQARTILVFGGQPDFSGLALYGLGALLFSQLSYVWFDKTKKGFADVL